MAGLGDWTVVAAVAGKSSWQSHGVNPPSKEGNGFGRNGSEEGQMEGKVEIMASVLQNFCNKEGRERSWGKGKKCSAGHSYLWWKVIGVI